MQKLLVLTDYLLFPSSKAIEMAECVVNFLLLHIIGGESGAAQVQFALSRLSGEENLTYWLIPLIENLNENVPGSQGSHVWFLSCLESLFPLSLLVPFRAIVRFVLAPSSYLK